MEITKEEIYEAAWNEERDFDNDDNAHGFIEGAEWVINKNKVSPINNPTEQELELRMKDYLKKNCFSGFGKTCFEMGIEWYKKQIALS